MEKAGGNVSIHRETRSLLESRRGDLEILSTVGLAFLGDLTSAFNPAALFGEGVSISVGNPQKQEGGQ